MRNCVWRQCHQRRLPLHPSRRYARCRPLGQSTASIASSTSRTRANRVCTWQEFRPKRLHSWVTTCLPVYVPEIDLEDFENYTVGGYHPALIGDTFEDGRYHIVHKLGFGSYSTIWLARDERLQRYVSLKILVASEFAKSTEAEILRLLNDNAVDSVHPGKRFVPCLLDEFSFDGPNGRHICLVQPPANCNIAASKEDSIDFMFPAETARSIAAQLIMAVSFLHSRGVCHGDLHLRNFLLHGPSIDQLSPEALYAAYRMDKAPVVRVDGAPVEPQAPSYSVYPMHVKMAADQLVDPIVTISDYGTAFVHTTTRLPELHTPPLYLPPEDFFGEPITPAADVWTLGASLYEVMGERPLFESFSGDRDDILADVISTLGQPPARWWDSWAARGEFFAADCSWTRELRRIYTPVFRPLSQRMRDMGRGDTLESCQWDVAGGEVRALEELLRGMLAWEPAERLTAEELMASEYMVKWAMPAWERQVQE